MMYKYLVQKERDFQCHEYLEDDHILHLLVRV